jgi:hypothetical protein
MCSFSANHEPTSYSLVFGVVVRCCFFKKLFFNFYLFFDYFDVLILKINFKK